MPWRQGNSQGNAQRWRGDLLLSRVEGASSALWCQQQRAVALRFSGAAGGLSCLQAGPVRAGWARCRKDGPGTHRPPFAGWLVGLKRGSGLAAAVAIET